ncbi:hypothetical protein KUV61_17475 [Nocardioides marinus]|nr:hypothetical protein [Nocardioides marinus]
MNFNETGVSLAPDELAFYFACVDGVEASALGSFLSRASTVAKRKGADLHITATHNGSLVVVARAAKRGGSTVGKEFASSPMQTAAATTVVVGIVVAGINNAVSSDNKEISPLAKACIALIEEHEIEKIQLVTAETTTLLMDKEKASLIAPNSRSSMFEIADELPRTVLFPTATDVDLKLRTLFQKGLSGDLTGIAIYAGPDLHFRPDGHRYLVPVEYSSNYDGVKLSPSKHYRVRGAIKFHDGVPERIEVEAAEPEGR